MLYEVISGTAFLASPYRRPVVGWMSDLDAMTAAGRARFLSSAGTCRPMRPWWSPATSIRSRCCGWRSATTAASRPAPVPARKPRVEPAQAGIRRVEHKAPAEQSYVALSFKVPQLRAFDASPENDDALALTVLAAVLDGYSGARLDRALTQGPDRVADSAGAGNGLWGRGPQLFTLDGVPAPGKTPEQVEAALRAEVAKVAREGVNEAELQRVKTQWIAGQVYKRDSVFSQAQELGSFWVQGLPLDASDRLIERLQGRHGRSRCRPSRPSTSATTSSRSASCVPCRAIPIARPRQRPAGVRD